jgi:hypothetical protein
MAEEGPMSDETIVEADCDLLPELSSVYRESLFRLCPSVGRAANSVGVSPLRLECGRLVL